MKRKHESSSSSFTVPKQGAFSTSQHNHSLLNPKSTPEPQQKPAQEPLSSRETITWGLTKGENYFETSYAQSYREHPSSKIVQRALAEPCSPPRPQLSGSLIPHDTPKFTKTKKLEERKNPTNLDRSFENGQKSCRRQYPDIKYKEDYTKDISLNSSKNYGNVGMTARSPSPDRPSPAKMLKTMHLHHSQVQESLCPESARDRNVSQNFLLYSQAFEETGTAGSSDLRKRVSPIKRGKKVYTETSRGSPIKELMSHSFTELDPQVVRKEMRSSSVLPNQSFQLRDKEYVERYKKTYIQKRSTSSVSNLYEEPRRSVEIQAGSLAKLSCVQQEGNDDRMSYNKSITDKYIGSMQYDSVFGKNSVSSEETKGTRTTQDISVGSKTSVEKLGPVRTEPDVDVRNSKHSQYVKGVQTRPKSPLTQRNLDIGRSRDGSQSVRLNTEESGTQKASGKTVKNGSLVQSAKKAVVSKVNIPTGKPKQGSFSGVNKKYIA